MCRSLSLSSSELAVEFNLLRYASLLEQYSFHGYTSSACCQTPHRTECLLNVRHVPPCCSIPANSCRVDLTDLETYANAPVACLLWRVSLRHHECKQHRMEMSFYHLRCALHYRGAHAAIWTSMAMRSLSVSSRSSRPRSILKLTLSALLM